MMNNVFHKVFITINPNFIMLLLVEFVNSSFTFQVHYKKNEFTKRQKQGSSGSLQLTRVSRGKLSGRYFVSLHSLFS